MSWNLQNDRFCKSDGHWRRRRALSTDIYIAVYSDESPQMWPPSSKQETGNRILLGPCFILISCLAYFSDLMMMAICSSETSVDVHQATLFWAPDDRNLHSHRWEDLKSTSNGWCYRRIVLWCEKISTRTAIIMSAVRGFHFAVTVSVDEI
jgi:hypothetical protein